MTFSIVARDPETGDLGIAVASKFLAVGSVVPHARAGVGAVATQSAANYLYGPDGLALMTRGRPPRTPSKMLTDADEGRDHRQAGIVDAQGRSATYTGAGCIDWAGGRTADNLACQGNILTGADVVDALFDTFMAGGAAFPELMLKALKAADERAETSAAESRPPFSSCARTAATAATTTAGSTCASTITQRPSTSSLGFFSSTTCISTDPR